MSTSSQQPPVPFADFQFSFDPSLHVLFPEPPPIPPSSELFSASETTNILGFLDGFNWEFELDHEQGFGHEQSPLDLAPSPTLALPRSAVPPPLPPSQPVDVASGRAINSASPVATRNQSSSSPSPSPTSPTQTPTSASSTSRSKTLLTNPQKRINHIMSEQKRRNAIRDGYAQLTELLAPAGAPPGLGMPTRGRPKGSGARGKGRPGQGKSGVLLRAVEYCKWLEEERDALLMEVLKVEAAAGIKG